jgi:hypothetical protein
MDAQVLPVAPVQLTIEEYIIASLDNKRAFILTNDATREAIIISPVKVPMFNCEICGTAADHTEDHHKGKQ